MAWDWGRARVAAVFTIFFTVGCTVMPPPVLSPRPARPVAGAFGFGAAYGFASATFRAPNGELVRAHGNGQNTTSFTDDAAALSGFFPIYGALRLATDGADATAYLQWQRAGLNTRLDVASFDDQTLALRLGGTTDFRGRAHEASLGFEHVLGNFSGWEPFYQLRVTLGRAHHKLEMPRGLDDTAGLDNRADVAKAGVYRSEVGGELTLAVTRLAWHQMNVTFAVAPSMVFDAGPLRDVYCHNCVPGTTLVDFDQTFALSLQLGFDPK